MTIDIRIQTLLRSAHVSAINFQLGPLQVSGAGYREVSDCLADHPIRHRLRVTVRPAIVGNDALAMYDPAGDKLNLRSRDVLDEASGRSQVVHECTHAQMDLRARTTRIRREESAAFIAEAWYLLNANENPALPEFTLTTDLISIASDLRTRAARAGGSVALTPAQVTTARQIMAQEYGYRRGTYRSDGIRGHRYRGP